MDLSIPIGHVLGVASGYGYWRGRENTMEKLTYWGLTM